MRNELYALLSQPWGGLVIAGTVLAVGLLLVALTRKSGLLLRAVGWFVCIAALLLAAGSVKAMATLERALAAHPAPGKLVDVGGFRMHILAEGDARGGPTLVWIPGSHAQGNQMYNFQKTFRGEARTILFDRAGTGWSEPGPFPRRTAIEAEELATLLDRAGEKGPFIFIGHSYGGLLGANFARRHKDRTAAVILLDATPPDALIYAPIYGEAAMQGLVQQGRREGRQKSFGLWRDPSVVGTSDTTLARYIRAEETLLADVKDALVATNARPSASWADASIFEEFNRGYVSVDAPDFVVYDGELDGIAVYVVIPEGGLDPAQVRTMGLPPATEQRVLNFFEKSRRRYLAVSDRAVVVHPPAGSSHNYPYEHPDFVADVVRRAIAEWRGSLTPPAVPVDSIAIPDSIAPAGAAPLADSTAR